MFPVKRHHSGLPSLCHAEPHRPEAPLAPFSMGQVLRHMSLPIPRSKNWPGMNLGYPFLQSLKECVYFLLCCWCIKELLD